MKVLFVTTKSMISTQTGGDAMAVRNFEAICSLFESCNVQICTTYFDEKKTGFKAKILEFIRNLVECNYLNIEPIRQNEIIKQATEYDVIFFDSSLFGLIAERLKTLPKPPKIITFFHNAEFDFRNPKTVIKFWKYVKYRSVYENERKAVVMSDFNIFLNNRDKTIVENKYGVSRCSIIPITLKDKCTNLDKNITYAETQVSLLFLGSAFPPNINGIRWFMENVLPRVNASLVIVGKGMGDVQDFKRFNNVKVFDGVDDLTPLLVSADIMVYPIFEGGGMKVKTCEALMFGKNIIGTPEAFCGYDVDFNKVGALCETKEEFIEKINSFDRTMYPKYNLYSRQVYLEKYSFDAVLGTFRHIFDIL